MTDNSCRGQPAGLMADIVDSRRMHSLPQIREMEAEKRKYKILPQLLAGGSFNNEIPSDGELVVYFVQVGPFAGQ